MAATVHTLLHAARQPSGLLHPFWPLMNSMLPRLLTASAHPHAIDAARTLIDELTTALADRAFAEAVWGRQEARE